jgi:UDP-N-acetyl-D-mannosaminuronate dehydrogenase
MKKIQLLLILIAFTGLQSIAQTEKTDKVHKVIIQLNTADTAAWSSVIGNIKNLKVLILGVAYKPGVGDVRETPVSELRHHLMTRGAEVAWHDPLVQAWEDSNPVNLDWDCDVAILATKQPGMNLEQLINRGVQILDCTNSLTGQAGISSL